MEIYDEVLKSSGRYARSNIAFVEAAINDYNNNSKPVAKKNNNSYANENNMVMENLIYRESATNRYHTFSETVRSALVTETLYKILVESVNDEVRNDTSSKSILRAIVSNYVNENGYMNILNRMRSASVTTSILHNIINENADKILKSVDKKNPDTFTITPAMKDEFFKQLDYSDSELISDAINRRVSDAMQDFITANTKDHEDITAALKKAQEKIAECPDDNELREGYEFNAKRANTEVRNRPKGVFHTMVSAMCESVIKHNEMHAEFMSEGKLNIEKIVSRTSLLYTFMEMLNTSRIDVINESFIDKIIKDLRS